MDWSAAGGMQPLRSKGLQRRSSPCHPCGSYVRVCLTLDTNSIDTFSKTILTPLSSLGLPLVSSAIINVDQDVDEPWWVFIRNNLRKMTSALRGHRLTSLWRLSLYIYLGLWKWLATMARRWISQWFLETLYSTSLILFFTAWVVMTSWYFPAAFHHCFPTPLLSLCPVETVSPERTFYGQCICAFRTNRSCRGRNPYQQWSTELCGSR